MSFGYAVGDFVLVTQLAWATVQNARRAYGAYGELTREVCNFISFYNVLSRSVEAGNHSLIEEKIIDERR
jgi:hypothetical protein